MTKRERSYLRKKKYASNRLKRFLLGQSTESVSFTTFMQYVDKQLSYFEVGQQFPISK